MKLYYILFFCVFIQSTRSDLIDSLKSKVKEIIMDSDEDKTSPWKGGPLTTLPPPPPPPVNLIDILMNRTEDFCSFTKLEKKAEELPDLEECNRINNRFKDDKNFDFINYFGETFNVLKTGIDSLKIPNITGGKINVIFFAGITGSGKTTLVQLLANDNTKIFSKETALESEDFIITDYQKIGTDTVTSKTLYPDLLVDKETGFVLVDNPGFEDTRSPVHELIASYGIRKVLKHTNKLKIVIVSTHSSLVPGMYRNDFPNLLKNLVILFCDTEKYKNSVYLIGTKVENTGRVIKGSFKPIPDEVKINAIADFLKEVKNSLSKGNTDINITDISRDAYIQRSIKVIDSLVDKKDGKYSRINLIRKPMDVGPLSEMEPIQEERRSIRKMLLSSENMIDVARDDFGFPLSNSALIYLNDIYSKMNSYIIKLSANIGEFMMTYFKNLIHSKTDLNEASDLIGKLKIKIRSLSDQIGTAKNPGEYINLISGFSEVNNLKLECLTTFKNISTLNEYLVNLEELSNGTKYTPLSWNISMKPILDFIETKEDQYRLLSDIFQRSSTYEFQNSTKSYGSDLLINGSNFEEFLAKINLQTRYKLINIDSFLLDNLNTILSITLKHKENVICENKTLVFTDYFIVLSQLMNRYRGYCTEVETVVIVSMHTLFVDYDLTDERFKNKELIIIAPIWEVVGTRTISVEGSSGGEKIERKADFGEIGKNGKNGKPGGLFFGIGMRFIKENNLKIIASGGNGQDGQDGGDGKHGVSGTHATNDGSVKEQSYSHGVYPFIGEKTGHTVTSGKTGEAGGDAGAGGLGGFGGKKGYAILHNIGEHPYRVSVVAEDGKRGENGKDGTPGKGGVKGCDREVKESKMKFLFITFYSERIADYVNCEQLPDGTVRRPKEGMENGNNTEVNNDSPVCIHIMNYQSYYVKQYHSLLSDGVTAKFITDMKLTKY